MQTVQKLSQIVEAGSRAGIHVMMSWDMNAELEDEHSVVKSFDAQAMLQKMELLFPKDGNFYFCNSGHDDVLNRFKLTLDDEAINPSEANLWATYINKVVDVAKKNARPSALKRFRCQRQTSCHDSFQFWRLHPCIHSWTIRLW